MCELKQWVSRGNSPECGEILVFLGEKRKMIQMSNTNRVLMVMASVALFGLVGCKQAPKAGAVDTAPVPAALTAEQAPAVDPSLPIPLNVGLLPLRGNVNAKVTIVEFSDYECPFCSRVEPTIDQILKDYPNDVRVAFVNNPLPFHQNAMPAAKAAVAAQRQGKCWEMHKELFANQKQLNEAFYKETAKKLGLDLARFEADMNSQETADFIAKGMKDGAAYGVQGTPGFLINGVLFVGAQPIAAFKKEVDAALARANKVASEKNLSGEDLYRELVKTAPKPAPEPEEAAPAGRVLVDVGNAPVLGDVNAPVTIVEFTDFECPFCSRGNTTLHQLLDANPGKARVIFKHYPLPFHKNAKLAHQAAEAAKIQGKFWEMYDLIFANQKAMSRDDLIGYAKQIGLDEAKFVADLDSDAVIKAVEAGIAEGSKAGVRGTPHFFFNGTLLSGAQPLPAFQAALDKELEVAKDPKYAGLTGNALYEKIVKDNAAPAPAPKAPAAPIVIDTTGAPFRGAADAPVTIVQFSEFQCPFCSRVEPTLDELLKSYEGKVKIVFKQMPLPFHNNAQKAAEASLFAHANGKFWELHKLMFANQGALDVENLKKYATEVGLDAAALEAALTSNQYEAAVTADVEAAQKAGISGTPTFVINGKLLVVAQPIDAFKKAVDEALAAAAK